ncbi:hypothetical protein HMPREF0682_2141 [Propionibacterium acidifaciens F0233]|uniref:ApeA N-terminal domain-containing protein n=1 Tax=Propionibacterium acidifaciens F0233 TaxID=553198 RepID=U2QBM0_9ACTN|nr:hypothetical protein [Propionibacterium acidifaciens]ERK53504.1 hypothetical protein HMPREF0682_2141 [Propionibacterium acidifaciens F0233]
MNLDEARKVLTQENMLRESLGNGKKSWTVLIDTWRTDADDGARYSALAPVEYREKALAGIDWDLSIGHGAPGFRRRKSSVEYLRNCSEDIEPIVVCQEFYNIVPNSRLISQELVLLMDLWQDPDSGNYYEIKDDGSKEESIRFSKQRVEIRTPLLRRYQAARQLDLLLFTTSTVSIITDEPLSSFSDLEIPEFVDNDHHSVLSRTIGEPLCLGRKEIVSSLDVKTILPPPPREKCGVWPWNENDSEEWGEFIIGEDGDGGPVRHTCEPSKLAERGGNPGAPSCYTPVFFRPDVLKQYYDDTDLYTVTSGHLTCGRKWGVDIHTDETDRVMVYLGDIGRRIPRTHHAHWRSYNIPPTRKMSMAAARRDFFNIPTETENPEHQFKNAYEDLQTAWHAAWGWSLHRPLEGGDVGIIKRLRIPVDDTPAEFEAQILNLTRLLIDSLNEKEMDHQLTRVKGEPGIAKLKRFLEKTGYVHVERDISFLKGLQKLRSKTAAHVSGVSGKKYLEKELAGQGRRDYAISLFEQAVVMLKDLASFATEDPRSDDGDSTREGEAI